MSELLPCPDGARLIPLTQGFFAIVDDEDFEGLNKYKWYWKGAPGKGSYVTRSAPKTELGLGHRMHVRMHNQIMKSKWVDHINGDGLDNRKENLRVCTISGNTRNQLVHKSNRLGIKGVSKIGRRFRAVIWDGRKGVTLGSFITADEAAHAYNKAAIRICGEFARINPVGTDPREVQS